MEFAGDIGGIFEFVYVIGILLTKGLTTYKYLALIANRMYLWTPVISNFTIKDLNEVPLEIPYCLEFWTLLSKCLCRCCLKKTAWGRYEEALLKIRFDLKRNMDITVILRRMRMNGFAIHHLLN